MRKLFFPTLILLLALLAALAPAPANAASYTSLNVGAEGSTPPAGVEYGGKFWIFFRNTSGGLGYVTTTNTSGGGPFSGVTTLSVSATNPEPEAIVFGGKLYLFYGEEGGAERLFYRTYNGSSWSAQVQVPYAVTRHRPGLAVLNTLLHIFWETAGSNNEIKYVSLNTSGTFFHPTGGPAVIPSARTVWAPTAVTYNNQIYVVYGGESGGSKELWYNALTTGNYWTGQVKVPGGVRSSCPPTSAVAGGQMHVYYCGATSYNLLRKRLSGGTWFNEEWISPLGLVYGGDAGVFSGNMWLVTPHNSPYINYVLP